jgi:uncharacterized Fe-S center protein
MPDNLENLVKKQRLKQSILKTSLSIKVHFGESGNLVYIRQNYVARMVKIFIKSLLFQIQIHFIQIKEGKFWTT